MNVFTKEEFQPDYTNILKVVHNERPDYLPLYEHHIDTPFMEKFYDKKIMPVSECKTAREFEEYYSIITNFWAGNGYDAFDYEAAICDIFPGHGAIFGGEGPIQSREDFEKYPWAEIPEIFKKTYIPHLDAIRKVMPQGMKAFGGCGYGIFEASEDLVGYESLCMMIYDDEDLTRDLFLRIGNLYEELWTWMLQNYSDLFVFNRMGDDMGHKTSTMLSPDFIKEHVSPQHKRIVDLVHKFGKKHVLHSCGNIFSVMDNFIDYVGIDGKHSNEDVIAPFETWIEKYGSKIGLFGGIDLNHLVLQKPDDLFNYVYEQGKKFRSMTKGYGIGSGNSIPVYIPVDGYKAMIEAVKAIRKDENK